MLRVSRMLETLFHMREAGTSVRTEILAGVATFLTMAYITVMNPNILSDGTGMEFGAVFTATIIAAVVGGIIGQIWNLVDPTLMERFADTMIGAFEMNDQIPESQKDEIITSMEESFEDQSSMGGVLKGIAINAGVLGFVNLLSGMIGAKIFASEEE